MQQFFYSGQIRRFLYQFIRYFSGFQVEFGSNADGTVALRTVPVFYGDSSRQVAQILQGNSENSMPSVPCMAVYITDLQYDRQRLQDPTFVSKLNIRERFYNSATGEWGHGQGNAFTVERLMPAPYKLLLSVDIWSSNTEQKFQLYEQIAPLFNPAMEIQNTDNYVDWSSLTVVWLMSTRWSSRTVPVGTGNPIDIATLTFEMPIWITPPAKVKQMEAVERLVSSLYTADGIMLQELADLPTTDILSRIVISPLYFGITIQNNMIKLFKPSDAEQTNQYDPMTVNTQYSWYDFVQIFGATIKNGISTIRLAQPDGNVIIGSVSFNPLDPTLLIFSPYIDTLPANDFAPITAIVDPFNIDVDTRVLNVSAGTRYIILNNIGSAGNISPAIAWKGLHGTGLIASKYDIIEYDGTGWFVSFNAKTTTDTKYVTNLTTGVQLKWNPIIMNWTKAVENIYQNGSWTIVLTTG
jgi:hypothetical protein